MTPLVQAWERCFLQYCQSCKHKHLMQFQPCPSCGGSGGWTAQPASANVRNTCHSLAYKCDGCEAYEDRYR